MSQASSPHRPRHARPEDPGGTPTDPATEAIPMIPVIPAQRSAPASSVPAGPPPAGLPPVATVPERRRRRILPAVLAAVTAVLLVAGLAVAVGGSAGTEMTDPPVGTSAP